eukprot:scaffold63367_cov61-Attheya_sp.AAC.4
MASSKSMVPIYTCKDQGGNTGVTWALTDVEAFLYDDHEKLSRFHFFNAAGAGKPRRWQVGEYLVTGVLITSLEAPEGSDKNINWLYVNVVYNHGQGALNKSTKISHICTCGGVLPASMLCTEANIDEQYKSPYEASYYF